MFKKYLVAFLAPFVLFGCGSDVVVPEKYAGKAVEYINEDYSIYDKNGLMAINVKAYVNGTLTPEQRIATAIELARKNQETTNAKLVFASIFDASMPKAGYMAKAELYTDKCGLDGETCNDVQWNISFSKNDVDSLGRDIYQYWWDNRKNFQLNGSTDEEALKLVISEALGIKNQQVSLFSYEAWSKEQY